MRDNEVRTEEFINALVSDEPSTRKRFGSVMGMAVALGALVAGGLFFVAIGFRPDIEKILRGNWLRIFEEMF